MSEPVDAPTRLVLIRHGESQVTVDRVVGGPRSCTGLSDLGRQQADRLAARLAETAELQPDVVYSSTYPRARQTADAVARVWSLDVAIEPGFGEHDPGPECDGLSFDEFVRIHGMPDWESDPHAVTFPGGETVAEFHLRVGAAVSSVLDRHRGESVVVVCHGGVVDAVVRTALRAVATGGFELHTKNTSLTELVRMPHGRWRLVRYNDAAHLAGLPDETPRGRAG